MELTVWRITSPEYAESAFTGVGAELYGGRFNSKGTKLVYTAGSLSLAMLELLVQANKRSRLADHVCIPATFDAAQMVAVSSADLPDGWDARPYTRVSQALGDEWLRAERSLVLRVPSVVVPIEYNYLINPTHPNFASLRIGSPIPAPFDARLLQEAE